MYLPSFLPTSRTLVKKLMRVSLMAFSTQIVLVVTLFLRNSVLFGVLCIQVWRKLFWSPWRGWMSICRRRCPRRLMPTAQMIPKRPHEDSWTDQTSRWPTVTCFPNYTSWRCFSSRSSLFSSTKCSLSWKPNICLKYSNWSHLNLNFNRSEKLNWKMYITAYFWNVVIFRVYPFCFINDMQNNIYYIYCI